MGRDLKLGIRIGVDAADGISAVQNLGKNFVALQKTLKANIGKIAALEIAERDADALAKSLEEAKRKVDFFKRSAEIAGDSGLKAFAKDIDKAKREVTSAEKAFNKQQTAVRGLRTDLAAAGVDTKNLAIEQARLTAQLNATARARELHGKLADLTDARQRANAERAATAEVERYNAAKARAAALETQLAAQIAARTARDRAAAANVINPETVVRRSAAARDAENRIAAQFSTGQLPDITRDLRAGAQQTRQEISSLVGSLVGLASLSAITQFSRSSVQEFAKAESAFRGLEAVANASGVGIGNAMREAEKLAADGLLGVSDASKALQNLLSRGYNLDQAVATINRLKDASAFNRQAALSMSEAVVGATEGIRNENSLLVDNAGVTKNVAKMWEEYAKQRRITTNEMTQAQKIEAEYNGIMVETAAQTGNAQKALAGFQGQMARGEQAVSKFKQSIGEQLAPTMAGLAEIGTSLINGVLKPLNFALQAAGVGAGFTAQMIGTIWDAITTRDFSRIRETVRIQGELAEKEIEGIARRISSDALKLSDGLSGGADPVKAKEVADKLSASAGAVAKSQQTMADEVKKAVESSIQDYRRLADAARAAWQQSLDAEKSYRDQAAVLRAKASEKPKDNSIEGQASARLDLINAEQKLQRIQTGSDLGATQRQAELVRQLAGNLTDQARAQEAIRTANLGEAAALEAAADAEKTRQDGLRVEWKKSEQTVKDLQTALESIGKGTAIKIESDAAKAVLDEITAKLDAIKDKTITVKVVPLSESGQPLDSLGVQAKAAGGPIVGPGGPTADQVLMLGSNGEHVLTAAEVAAAGGHAAIYRLRAAIIAGSLPRFAAGGAVMSAASAMQRMAVPGAPATASIPSLGRLDLGVGGGSYPVYAAPDVAMQLASAVRVAALKRGSR